MFWVRAEFFRIGLDLFIAVDIRHVLHYDITMGNNWFRLKLRWVLLLFLCCVACASSDKRFDYQTESLKIYRLLIRHNYLNEEEGPVLINQLSLKLGDSFFYEQLLLKTPKIDHEALEDFILNNRDVSRIAVYFPLDCGYRFLSFAHDEDPKIHDRKFRNYMNRVKKVAPYSGKKIIEFSKVGFNKKINQAIVEYCIYGTSLTLFPSGADTSDDDTIVLGGIVLLEKKLGPFPHVWAIKDPHLEYHN